MNIKIFVLTDDDIRLARRLMRDCAERQRTISGVLMQYNRFVKKSYDEYIKPTMKHSDIIVPFGSDNTTAVEFIVQNLQNKLKERQRRMGQIAKEQYEKTYQFKSDIETWESLDFELVDYAVDYTGFKEYVSYFKAGNKINFKLEMLLKQLVENIMPSLSHMQVTNFAEDIITLYKEKRNVLELKP